MTGFSFDLRGRVVLVTGASSGLGRRFAGILAASGARVVIGARRAQQLDALADEIVRAGGEALAVPMDVTDEASIIAAYDAAAATFGPVDSVIANAGLNVAGSALGLSATAFDEMMAVNLRGVFLTVARRRAPHDCRRGTRTWPRPDRDHFLDHGASRVRRDRSL